MSGICYCVAFITCYTSDTTNSPLAITLQRTPNCVTSTKAPPSREGPTQQGIRYHEAPASQNRCAEVPSEVLIIIQITLRQVTIECPKSVMGGASKNLVCASLKHLSGASEHHSVGVLRGTLDRGPLKHQIGSCIWDNVKDPMRSFRAPFVVRVYITECAGMDCSLTI